MKEIEDAYQEVADRIAAGRLIRRLSSQERQIVTDMYALWNIRWHWKDQPVEDQRLEGVTGVQREYSIDEQEMLEKNHITTIRPDVSIPGHHITGIKIQLNLFEARKSMKNVEWGILKSRAGQFIVPDNSARRLILPVTPEICLANTEGYRLVTKSELSGINEQSIQGSTQYYFARDL